jgi:hypothetical protein
MMSSEAETFLFVRNVMEKASLGYQAKSCTMSGKRRATWSRHLVGRSSIRRAQPAWAYACILRRDSVSGEYDPRR